MIVLVYEPNCGHCGQTLIREVYRGQSHEPFARRWEAFARRDAIKHTCGCDAEWGHVLAPGVDLVERVDLALRIERRVVMAHPPKLETGPGVYRLVPDRSKPRERQVFKVRRWVDSGKQGPGRVVPFGVAIEERSRPVVDEVRVEDFGWSVHGRFMDGAQVVVRTTAGRHVPCDGLWVGIPAEECAAFMAWNARGARIWHPAPREPGRSYAYEDARGCHGLATLDQIEAGIALRRDDPDDPGEGLVRVRVGPRRMVRAGAELDRAEFAAWLRGDVSEPAATSSATKETTTA